MVTREEIENNWYKDAEAFEILHYLAQFENPGIDASQLKDLRGQGTVEEAKTILEGLENVGAVISKERNGKTEYWLQKEIFAEQASKRWINSLSDKQRDFINSFTMKFLDDREEGNLRRVLTESMIQGIYEQRENLENEIIDIAREMSLDKEAYENPGIYAELAMREIQKE